MKKLIGIFLMGFSAFQIQAQDVKGNPDQVKTLLCKTWEISYSMTEGTKVVRAAGGKNLIYTFNPDGTVYFYDHSKTKITQDWTYDEVRVSLSFQKMEKRIRKLYLYPKMNWR